jgi:lysophospholipase L1-like esterase
MQPMRFLALGDSYTIGESVPSVSRWPNLLTVRLRAEGFFMADPVILARTGWTTAELRSGIDHAKIKKPYDLVSLGIGVNNQYRGGSLDVYRSEFCDLLALAVGFAGGNPGRVMVLSIPDWSVTPYARGRDRQRITTEIEAFNAINHGVAKDAGVAYIDVTPLSRLASTSPDWVAGDGLHPSGLMYAAWVDLMLPTILDLLQNQGPLKR